VLLIMGLGLSGGAWWRTVPVLARRFRVITFDNRGVGQSRSSTYSYTTEAMADDAASVLDAAGLDAAHVYGISLGGMVAQQMVLRHADRVASLVLGATHPGGRRTIAPRREVMDFIHRRLSLSQDEAAWASVPFNYSPECRRLHSGRIGEDVAQRLAHPFPSGAYQAQLFAAHLHNCLGRLSRVHVPTLIVHGREDRLIPVQNAYLMGKSMPHAELEILERCGHLYPTEQPQVDERI
jgi:3-oxoadipate enol-lactonase